MVEDSTILISDIDAALKAHDQGKKNSSPCLVGISEDINGKIFDLCSGTSTFGRGGTSSYPLPYPGVSRRHFRILFDGQQALLNDLDSRNGTYLNNQKITQESKLIKGDMIKVGHLVFKYLPPGDPERLTYDKLYNEANKDGLTQCYNKTFFNNACDAEVKKSRTSGAPLSLIIFDLDHFKKLNDQFGHDAGDYCLKEFAQLVRKTCLRERDIFARYGGEEFVVLLPHTNLKTAYKIAERIRISIAEYAFLYEEKKLPVTCSIGISDYRLGVSTGVELFKRADEAVYKAKNNGRNQTHFYRS